MPCTGKLYEECDVPKSVNVSGSFSPRSSGVLAGLVREARHWFVAGNFEGRERENETDISKLRCGTYRGKALLKMSFNKVGNLHLNK